MIYIYIYIIYDIYIWDIYIYYVYIYIYTGKPAHASRNQNASRLHWLAGWWLDWLD